VAPTERPEGSDGAVPRRRARAQPSEQRRRALAEAAADAFHRRGFHGVTVAGVAAEVGVSAPAVYRHFRSKSELLVGAIETGLDEIDEALRRAADDGGGLDAIIDRLASAAQHRSDFWTLSQREIRHLPDSDQQRMRKRFRRATADLGHGIEGARPGTDDGTRDLLVTASLAALATPATLGSDLSPVRLHHVLRAATSALCVAPLPPPRTRAAPRPTPLPPEGRTSEVFATAVALFHQRGYAAVSLDDIGAAVGMAGPSIYHHYASKADLLVAAALRFLSAVPPASAESDAAVVAHAYAEAAIRERECVGVLVTEAIELPPEAAARINALVSDDLAGWSAMVAGRRPDLDPLEAALLAQTARSIVHDVARLGVHHRRPEIVDELTALTSAVIDVRY
jgi:AcrR family transcriptional regulator